MNDMINCLVVDDEHLARTLLENYINRLSHLHLVKLCKSPTEAIAVLQKHAVDLLFLDIQMPELTGIELLKTLRQKPLVIFTTAYSEYALQGYELDVIDYLVKPFSFERFVQAVNKASAQLQLRRQASLAITREGEKENSASEEIKDYLLIRADHKIYKVFFADILYIQGMREYVTFHTTQGKIMCLMSMKKLEEDLPAARFVRIHKSYIVASGRVTTLEGNRVVIGTEKLPIGNFYKDLVIERIFK